MGARSNKTLKPKPKLPKGAALKKFKKRANPLKGVEYIDYKDVALLRRFISDKGKLRSARVTGVSVQQQRMIARAVKNAREMALLPYPNSAR
jgi:small subunit ribosomal protein S18